MYGSLLSRLDCLAKERCFCDRDLRFDTKLSKAGTLRINGSVAARRRVHPKQHRRRPSALFASGVPSFSQQRTRFPRGDRNPTSNCAKPEISRTSSRRIAPRLRQRNRTPFDGAYDIGQEPSRMNLPIADGLATSNYLLTNYPLCRICITSPSCTM